MKIFIWLGILRPFRKWAYVPAISEPRAEKIVSDFRILFLIFLTDLILSDKADKNMDR